MTFDKIFKKSFLQAVNMGDVSLKSVALTMVIASVLAAYVFFIYRIVTRKTFYNKNFNISLALIAVIVTAIIITIQSSIVVSLGMVGALSIVRFRTAIKDPMDLAFLFWSIAIGIICGAGLPGIAIVTSVVITVGVFVLDMIPVAKVPILLVVNAENKDAYDPIIEAVQKNTKAYYVKSKTIEKGHLDLIVEVRTKDTNGLLESVSDIGGIQRCSLLSHDGEVTF